MFRMQSEAERPGSAEERIIAGVKFLVLEHSARARNTVLVSVKDGVVKLEGYVESKSARRKIESGTLQIDGVSGCVNRLQVSPGAGTRG